MSKDGISEEQVRYVAQLARLQLSAEETSAMTRDLSSILSYVSKLNEFDTKDVPATSHAVTLNTKYRSDEPRPGLPVEQGLRDAPERIDDGFGVPKIVE